MKYSLHKVIKTSYVNWDKVVLVQYNFFLNVIIMQASVCDIKRAWGGLLYKGYKGFYKSFTIWSIISRCMLSIVVLGFHIDWFFD